ncbi:hypothetical protein L1967_01610 [Zunongwangia sp. M21534]|uniref:Signal peptidase n=1 Tax=Zunongwangia pacifica TaxID=2911062 RepID=A0A9X2CIP0_9FLAO|nr:hypothetical protein [Zunongwangia pacifica]
MKKRFLILTILLFSITTNPVFANDGSDPPNPGKAAEDDGLPPPPGRNVPIDSNLSFLLVGGLFIGVTYIFRSYSKKVQ